MISIILYIFLIGIFCIAPLPVQFVMLIVNTFIPDPIPCLDEMIMYISFAKKLASLGRMIEFIEDHPVISALLGVGIIGGIIYIIASFF